MSAHKNRLFLTSQATIAEKPFMKVSGTGIDDHNYVLRRRRHSHNINRCKQAHKNILINIWIARRSRNQLSQCRSRPMPRHRFKTTDCGWGERIFSSHTKECLCSYFEICIHRKIVDLGLITKALLHFLLFITNFPIWNINLVLSRSWKVEKIRKYFVECCLLLANR